MLLSEIPISPFSFEHPKAIIATVIGFVLLLVVIYRYGKPPIERMLGERARQVAEVYTHSERQLAEALQVRDEYAARIAGIEQEHRARLDAAVRDAEAAHADILADAREGVLALRRRSEQEIDRERTRQRILLRRLIVQFTLDAAEQSIRELNSDTAQRRLIDDFITRVGSEGVGKELSPPATGNGSTPAPVAAVATPVVAAEAPAALRSQSQSQEGA